MRRDTLPPVRGWRTPEGPWATYPVNKNGASDGNGTATFLESQRRIEAPTGPSREIVRAVAATIYGWGGASRVGPATALLPMGCRLRASIPLRHFPRLKGR
jgi:hypothetical protein